MNIHKISGTGAGYRSNGYNYLSQNYKAHPEAASLALLWQNADCAAGTGVGTFIVKMCSTIDGYWMEASKYLQLESYDKTSQSVTTV